MVRGDLRWVLMDVTFALLRQLRNLFIRLSLHFTLCLVTDSNGRAISNHGFYKGHLACQILFFHGPLLYLETVSARQRLISGRYLKLSLLTPISTFLVATLSLLLLGE